MEKQPDNAQVKKSAVLHALLNKNELGTILPLCLLLIVVGCVNPNFFAMNNILDILKTSSFSFIVAVPITFLMASGGMDLSIGAATSFGGVVCAFALKAGMPIPVSIVLALGAGAVVGVINGIVIVYRMRLFRVPAGGRAWA